MCAEQRQGRIITKRADSSSHLIGTDARLYDVAMIAGPGRLAGTLALGHPDKSEPHLY